MLHRNGYFLMALRVWIAGVVGFVVEPWQWSCPCR